MALESGPKDAAPISAVHYSVEDDASSTTDDSSFAEFLALVNASDNTAPKIATPAKAVQLPTQPSWDESSADSDYNNFIAMTRTPRSQNVADSPKTVESSGTEITCDESDTDNEDEKEDVWAPELWSKTEDGEATAVGSPDDSLKTSESSAAVKSPMKVTCDESKTGYGHSKEEAKTLEESSKTKGIAAAVRNVAVGSPEESLKTLESKAFATKATGESLAKVTFNESQSEDGDIREDATTPEDYSKTKESVAGVTNMELGSPGMVVVPDGSDTGHIGVVVVDKRGLEIEAKPGSKCNIRSGSDAAYFSLDAHDRHASKIAINSKVEWVNVAEEEGAEEEKETWTEVILARICCSKRVH